MPFTVATWNVNSVRARLTHVLNWLNDNPVDYLGLQETKTPDEHFPPELNALESHPHLYLSGQKSYNGVATFSTKPATPITTQMHPEQDPQKRFICTTHSDCHLVNLYIPNGATLESDKYAYKLTWLSQCLHFIDSLKKTTDRPIVVVGDFNIAPTDLDVHDPEIWQNRILVSPPERAWFQEVLDLGFYDSYRQHNPDTPGFSWWDYRAGGFRRNHGLRIDFILATHDLQCTHSWVDQTARAASQPSDHAPVISTFNKKQH